MFILVFSRTIASPDVTEMLSSVQATALLSPAALELSPVPATSPIPKAAAFKPSSILPRPNRSELELSPPQASPFKLSNILPKPKVEKKNVTEENEDGEDDLEYELFAHRKPGNVYSCRMHATQCFASKEEFKRHVAKHTADYMCTACSKTYTSKYNLEAHVRNVHDGLLVKCTVEDCASTFKTKGGYHKHFNSVHKFACVFCTEVYTSESKLKNHACAASKRSICTFCLKEFKTITSCKRHTEESCLSNPAVMQRKYPEKCEHCSDSFITTEVLAEHQERCVAHVQDHTYYCHKCMQKFRSREQATEHTAVCHSR